MTALLSRLSGIFYMVRNTISCQGIFITSLSKIYFFHFTKEHYWKYSKFVRLLKCCKNQNFYVLHLCYMKFYFYYAFHIYLIHFVIYICYIFTCILYAFYVCYVYLLSYHLILNSCDNVSIFIICSKSLKWKILIIKKIFVF